MLFKPAIKFMDLYQSGLNTMQDSIKHEKDYDAYSRYLCRKPRTKNYKIHDDYLIEVIYDIS